MIVKCGHCGKSSTTIIRSFSPTGASYQQTAICCSYCHSIVGVTGYFDTGQLIKNQEKEIASLKASINQLSHQVAQIAQFLSRR